MIKLLVCLLALFSISSFGADRILTCAEDGKQSAIISFDETWLGNIKNITIEDELRSVTKKLNPPHHFDNFGPIENMMSILSISATSEYGDEITYDLELDDIQTYAVGTTGIPVLVAAEDFEQIYIYCTVTK